MGKLIYTNHDFSIMTVVMILSIKLEVKKK
jgi:hypothetical protein